MDQHWGDDEWHHDGDYAGDADTADLSGPDTPLSGAFDGHGGDAGFDGHPGDGLDQPDGGDLGDPQPGGGYLEDDPMGAFGHDGGDAGHDPSDHDLGDPGHDADAEIPPLDAGLHGDPGDHDSPGDPGDPGEHTEHPGYDDPAEALHSTETTVGADPDVDPDADWAPADFPEQLDVNPPEPVDGYPWSDASAVAGPGTAETTDPADGPTGAPGPQELLEYAGADGNGGDPWNALLGSDDPAASTLGRWWAPS